MAAQAVPPPPLHTHLETSDSLLDLASAVGKVCLDHPYELDHFESDRRAEGIQKEIEARFFWFDEEGLLEPDADGNFAHLLERENLQERFERAETFPPIGELAILRALLRPLGRMYEETTGVVELTGGTPVPIATRGINNVYSSTTPTYGTSGHMRLLAGTGFYLFDFGADARVPIQLDFSARERLDELTWSGKKRLPKVATVHPRLGKDGVKVAEEHTTWFFGVSPRDCDLDAILAQLEKARDKAEVAVLPELSLPQADSLEEKIAAEPKAYPPLIVAGSAHVREGQGAHEVRANEARIYLDGKLIGRHRKIHAFRWRRALDGSERPPLMEGLTRERKPLTVYAGDYTRMAVAICSDLINNKLAVQLEDAGVNLLLVPALTPEPGSFNGDICKLASHCQAVSVIVNVDSSLFSRPRPFMVMAAIPRPLVKDQAREYRRRLRGGPAVGIFNPNRRLWKALRWL